MSVQVRRRREAAAYLQSFVGAQGELLVDTTNNRVQVHDGATPGGWPAAKLADIAQRTAIADANYAALPTDRTIAFTALTAARAVTLPAAAAYPTGTQLMVVDEAGACSATNTITLARAGADTINGAASVALATAYGYVAVESNGAGKWTIVAVSGAGGSSGGVTAAQLSGRNAVLNGNFAINQRGTASGTALAAGAYAHDRWKAGANGCTYTFAQAVPDTSATITAGSLIQPVDAPNVTATIWWLSWTGTATARVWQGSASGSFAAGTSASVGGVTVNTLMVSGLTIGAVANIEFQAGPNGGSVGLVQFEPAVPGLGPTRFERRHGELALCQRYYFRRVASGTKDVVCMLSAYNSTASWGKLFDFPVQMRAVPTINYSALSDLRVWGADGSSFGSPAAISGLSASQTSAGVYGGIAGHSSAAYSPGQALFLTFQTTTGWVDVSAEI